MAALVMAGLQFGGGVAVYLWPGGTPGARAALSPWHRFAGQAVYLTGLAAAAVSKGRQGGSLHDAVCALLPCTRLPWHGMAWHCPPSACPPLHTHTPLSHAPLQAGLQEKAAFLQAFGSKGVRSGYIALPAAAELGLLLTGLLVMAHQAGPQQAAGQGQAQAYRPVGDDLEEDGGGDGGGSL